MFQIDNGFRQRLKINPNYANEVYNIRLRFFFRSAGFIQDKKTNQNVNSTFPNTGGQYK